MSPDEVEKVLEDEEFDITCLRKEGPNSGNKCYDYSLRDFIGNAEKQGLSITYSRFEGPLDTVHYLDASGEDGSGSSLKLRKFHI